MLASMIQKFNLEAQKHMERQSLNPFSGSFSRSPSPRLSNDEYGKPIAGSKTEERGKKAKCHVLKEVLELCNCIYDVATNNAQASKDHQDDQDDEIIVTFKEIFQIYTNINDKVVGLLIAAKKKGFIYFEKEILFQRQDDDVLIALIKPISEIRAIIYKEIYPQASTASTKLPKEEVEEESNSECNQDLHPGAETDNGNEKLPQVAVSDVISDGEIDNSGENPEIEGNGSKQIGTDQQVDEDQHNCESLTTDDGQVSANDLHQSESVTANDIKTETEPDLCLDGLKKGIILEDVGQEILKSVDESASQEDEIQSETLNEVGANYLAAEPAHVESSYPPESVIDVQGTENEKSEIINSDYMATHVVERTNSINNDCNPINCDGTIPLAAEDTNQTPESKITQIEIVLNDKEEADPISHPNEFEYKQDVPVLNQVSLESSQEEKSTQNDACVEELQNLTTEDGVQDAQLNRSGTPEQNQQVASDDDHEITSSVVDTSDSMLTQVESTNETDPTENPSTESLEKEVSHDYTDIIPTSDDSLLIGKDSTSSELEVCYSCESITDIGESNVPQIDKCLEIIQDPFQRSTTPDNCDKEVESILEQKTSLLGDN